MQDQLKPASPKQVMLNRHMDMKRFPTLIAGLYGAALEPSRWSAAATQIADFFDLESTAIQLRNDAFSSIALRATTANYSPGAQQAYAAHFHKLDPWANGWRAIGRSGIFAGPELTDTEALRKSDIYNDHLRRIGVFHFLGAGLNLAGGAKLLLGIHRPLKREDFTAEHREHLEAVLPHLSRAVQIHSLLAAAELQRHLTCELFKALSIAVIVVDAGGRVVFANQLAECLLAAGNGLTVRQTRLTTRDPKQEASLRQAIAGATLIAMGGMAPPSDVVRVRRAQKRPLSILVAPFRRDVPTGGGDDLAIIFVNDPEWRRPPPAAALATLYRLTPAETRLLGALLQGERIVDYANRVGISTNTATTQLKQIFRKTETNRQADLVQQVLSDPIASLAHKDIGRLVAGHHKRNLQ